MWSALNFWEGFWEPKWRQKSLKFVLKMQLAFLCVFKHIFCDFSCFWKSAGEDMYHFFVLILHRCFVDFFVDFKSLETLKIVLPCRREHYFYKIDVFASSPKIDKKTSKFGFRNPRKFEKKTLRKRVCKHVRFWHRFLVIFGTILPPKLEAKIVDFSYFLLIFRSKLRSLLR